MRQNVQSQGKAGAIALVAETVLFWLCLLIPASLFTHHQQSGSWNPQLDPESWARFTSILSGCYVFCKIPPIEAARWAWVFAWTPWIAENILGGTPQGDSVNDSVDAL